MKYAILLFAIFVSISAITANTTKTTRTVSSMTTMPANNDITQLDDLVRGELAAMEAYDQLIKDTKDEDQKNKLLMIRKDHEQAVSKLSKYVAGKPKILKDTEKSGPWGQFSKGWVKGGKLMGNKTAVRAIKEGEEHGIREYIEALQDDSLNAELKNIIRTELLPSQQKHIDTLKTFM